MANGKKRKSVYAWKLHAKNNDDDDDGDGWDGVDDTGKCEMKKFPLITFGGILART